MSTAKQRKKIEAGVHAAVSAGPAVRVVAPAVEPGPPRARPRASESAFRIPTKMIAPDPGQPRKDIPAQSIEALAASMTARGQLQPIRVRRDGDGYLIVCGERRWRAAMHAGLAMLDCRVVADGELAQNGEAELRADQVAENVMREDLAPMDLARALGTLRDGHGWTQAKIAERVGLGQSAVSKSLALLGMSEPMQALLDAGLLSPATAREIVAGVADPEAQVAMGNRVVKEGLSRDQVAAEARGNIPREYPEVVDPATSIDPREDIPGEYSEARPPAREVITAPKPAPRGRETVWGYDLPSGASVSVVLPPGVARSEIERALFDARCQFAAESTGTHARFPIGCTVRVTKSSSPLHLWQGEVIGYTPRGDVEARVSRDGKTRDWAGGPEEFTRIERSPKAPAKGANP